MILIASQARHVLEIKEHLFYEEEDKKLLFHATMPFGALLRIRSLAHPCTHPK